MHQIITRESNLPLEVVCARLPAISAQHKFGVLGIHDLREKMVSKGVAFARECRVFEVCNPQQAQAILNQNIEVSTALPCRISAYTENGRTVLATIKPSSLLGLFGAAGGEGIAREVETSLVRIMDEACAANEKTA
jgi:uncharacterized protein (DUF302 family)